eukprot:6024842-Pyramimonas_sp.AAC.1
MRGDLAEAAVVRIGRGRRRFGELGLLPPACYITSFYGSSCANNGGATAGVYLRRFAASPRPSSRPSDEARDVRLTETFASILTCDTSDTNQRCERFVWFAMVQLLAYVAESFTAEHPVR